MKRLAALIPAAALVLTVVACGQTDAGISTAVKSKLAADDTVKAYQLDVDTANGVVTLTGAVDSAIAKDRALMLARDTDGVRDVVDNVEISDTAATTGAGVDADVDINTDDARDTADRVGDATADGARRTGDAAREGAAEVAEGAKAGAKAVGDGAKKVGAGIRDAVTDDDPDTNRDGK